MPNLRCLVLLLLAVTSAACGGDPSGPDASEPPDGRRFDAEPDEPDADTGAPETTITAAPPALDNSTTAVFELASDDPEATFRCRLDGGAETACSSPHELTGLAAGEHTVEVAAVDDADNADATPAAHTWTIDLTSPDTAITGGPSGVVASAEATFELSAVRAAGGGFECSLDAAAFAPCTSPLALTGLAEGNRTLRVRAVDAAGNVDPTPAVRGWTVDLTPPETTITAGPAPVTGPATSFTFTASEAVLRFECSLDAAAFAPCTAGNALTGLAAGAHAFQVRAVDLAGTVDPTPAAWAWTVDTAAPDTTIVSAVPSSPAAAITTFTFSSDDAGAGFQCSLDAAGFAACTSPRAEVVGTGTHTFRVRAVDAVGNVDPTPAAATWITDATAPRVTGVTSPTPDGAYGPGDELVITVAWTEPVVVTGAPVLALETGAVNRDAVYTGGSGTTTLAFAYTVQPGDLAMDLDYAGVGALTGGTVADTVGNPAVLGLPAPGAVGSLAAGKALRVDGVAPVVDIDAPVANAVLGPWVNINWSVSSDAVTVACAFDGVPATCPPPWGGRPMSAGPHTFAATATDAAGNVGSATVAFTVVCGPVTGGLGQFAVFHFDEADGAQTAANALSTGDAVLGATAAVEPVDPSFSPAGRFGGGLAFSAAELDRARWTTDVGAGAPLSTDVYTIMLWARVDAAEPGPTGTRLFTSGDGRVHLVAIRDGDAIRFRHTIIDDVGIPIDRTSDPVALGVLHHVVMQHSVMFGDESRLVVDGVATATISTGLGGAFQFGTVTLGDPVAGFDGVLDELFVGTSTLLSLEAYYCPM